MLNTVFVKLYLMVVVTVTDDDGLAMGSKFVGISTIQYKLSQDFWSWSKPPYSQRDMEGSQVLSLLWETLFNAKRKIVWCFSWFSILLVNILSNYGCLYINFNSCYFQCSTWMTIVVPTSMTAYLYLYSHGEVSLAASQPVQYLLCSFL